MTTPQHEAPRPRRAAPAPVTVLAAVMAALAVALDVSPAGVGLHVTWPVVAAAIGLAAAFWVVEVAPIHLEWAGQAYSTSLSEVPLVVGLFCCPSPLLIIARVVGGGIALAWKRKQPPHKLAFNVSLQLLEASLALVIFNVIPGHGSAHAMHAAPAALTAILASSVAGMIAVCLAVQLSVGHLDAQVLGSFLRTTTFAIVVNTSIALVLATALWHNALAAPPIVVTLVAGSAVYRAYVVLRQRHSSLEMLYEFTSGLNQTTTTDRRIRDILLRMRRMLRADIAGVLLTGSGGDETPMVRWIASDGLLHTEEFVEEDGDWPVARVINQSQVIVIPRGSRLPEDQAFLTVRQFRDAVLAPLELDGHVRGVLFVANREGDVASFTDDDARLFQTVAVQVSSVLDNSRLLDRLTHESLHDALTGLANRQCFQSRLRHALSASSQQVAVMLADLDRFKEINDTLGHHHGDLLIREIAERIVAAAPAIATVARLGGDEFALLVPGLDGERARVLADRIRAAIAEPCTLDGVSVDVNASVGIAVAPDHGDDDSVLLKRADMAMYAAKSAHSGVEIYDHERDEYSPRRLALASRLRAAVDDGEMTLHYQPQIDAATGTVVGAEALIRWNHPDYGMVSPVEFIPIAEQTGAINELTQWVMEQAVEQLAMWRSEGLDLGVSVNASMRNLLDASVVDSVRRLLVAHGIPKDGLTLEITESLLMSDPARTLPILHRLAAIGVRLSIDDFGTGYSSLSYLNELPVHELKIDKSFLHNDSNADSNAAIVRAIVSMSQHLGLETVAEGVEDEAAERSLIAVGCTRLQGYHFARPMPAAEFRRWLAERELPRQRNGGAPAPLRAVR